MTSSVGTYKPPVTGVGVYKPAPASPTANPFTGADPYAKPAAPSPAPLPTSNRNNVTDSADSPIYRYSGSSAAPVAPAAPVNAPSGSGAVNAGENQKAGGAPVVSSLQVGGAGKNADGTPKTAQRYTTAADKAATDYLGMIEAPDLNKIKEQKRAEIQAQIDAVNQSYTDQLTAVAKTGEENKGKNRALMGRSGLQGSDFGNAQEGRVAKDANDALAVKRNEQMVAVQQLFDKADERAQTAYNSERALYAQQQGKLVEYLQGVETEAKNDFIAIAQSGVIKSLDQMSTQDKEMWKQQTGWSDFMVEAVFNSNKPKAAQIDWKQERVGNTLIYSGVDPVTGLLKVIKQDLGMTIPQDSNVQVLPNGAMVIMPKQIDPTKPLAEQMQIIGGEGQFGKLGTVEAEYEYYKKDAMARGEKKILNFSDYQTLDANRKASIARAGASTTTNITKEQNKFQDDISAAQKDLASGITWGAVRDNLYSRYKTGDAAQDKALSDILDRNLDKNTWIKPGAYQEFKKSTQSAGKSITLPDGTVIQQ